MGKDIRQKAFTNLIWRFAERCGAQGVSFIVSIVLARILEPDIYGTIALVTVFTTLLQVFVDSGLGNALIQKKDADDLDFSTVFYVNILICTVLYIGMYAAAPAIASFYGDMTLIPVIRVLSLTLVIAGVKNVQQAYVARTLEFKKFFFATLGGTIGAAAVGIILALKGYGVWALVGQQIFNATVDTLILWITVKWRPKLVFSFTRLKGLFSYGWKLLVSSLINTAYNDIWQLIIGKVYTPADLAYYNRGEQFPKFIVGNVNTSIDSVLLPVMAREQDNKERVRSMTRRSIMISIYIMAPLMMGLIVMAPAVVQLILTDKWMASVPFLRIFCVVYMFQPIHTANLNAIKALGRSDLFLKLEIIKKVVGIALLLITMRYGVLAMAYSLLINSVASQVINSWPNKKLLDYHYIAQIKDILPNILIAAVMGAAVWPLLLLPLNLVLIVVMQVLLGAVVYIAVSYVTKNESFLYLSQILMRAVKKRKA